MINVISDVTERASENEKQREGERAEALALHFH